MKEKIIEFNKQFHLNTEFIIDSEIEGYSIGNTIYLNENSSDIEKVNKHELLHFFENDETFQKLKEEIIKLNKEKIKIIRKEYYLRYYGLYSEEEIQNGIIDTEIVIDMLIDNYVIEYKEGLKLGDYVLTEITKNLEQKRYLNLSIKSQIQNMKISKWDKIFITNFYDGKEHIFPQKEGREKRIEEDIKRELKRLYNLSEEYFIIDPNSEDVEREYESELKAVESRGIDTGYFEDNKEQSLKEIANNFSKQLYEEYKHIVDYIKGTTYEESFKVLMLRETLSKTYKLDTTNGKKTIVNKREKHKTIASHMTLNEIVLDIIYNNIDEYDNFANLYFAGLEIFNKTIAQKNNISLDNVDTYGLGHWIKFEGKTTNERNYIKNAQELSSLVKDTPWCTKDLASSQLAQGDFYVFVDNNNSPHIAVKMNGNEIDEVRGILNGKAQELEEEYRKVAISFLENNKDIKNGKEWLRKEEWNKRLIQHIENIKNNCFESKDMPDLIENYFGQYEYKSHSGTNTNKEKLKSLLPKIKKNIVEYYNCSEEEIAVGDIEFSDEKHKNLTVCPYKVIFGEAYFNDSKIQSLGNLTTIGGFAYFSYSQIQSLDTLTSIGGSARFDHSQIQSLGDLTTIGGNANFDGSQIQSLGNLTTIGGDAHFESSQIQSLGNLTTIGGDAHFESSQVQDLGNLTTIGGDANFTWSKVQSLGNLTTIAGQASFSDSQIQSLDNLITIGEDANFAWSKVQSLGNLTTIGGDVWFRGSQVQNLGSLTTIGGDADFTLSKVQSLGNLTTIAGQASFSDSQIQSLDNLITIGGDAYFEYSQIRDFGNIEYIGGVVYADPELMELCYQEFEYGHRKQKTSDMKL